MPMRKLDRKDTMMSLREIKSDGAKKNRGRITGWIIWLLLLFDDDSRWCNSRSSAVQKDDDGPRS
jgi:hypothetical protein